MSSASAESDHAAQKGDDVETQNFASPGGIYHIRTERRRKILRLYMEGGSTPRHAGSGHEHIAHQGGNVKTQNFASPGGGSYHIRTERRRKILRLYMEGGNMPRHAGSGHAKARPYIANS